jgi:hypothetical protein
VPRAGSQQRRDGAADRVIVAGVTFLQGTRGDQQIDNAGIVGHAFGDTQTLPSTRPISRVALLGGVPFGAVEHRSAPVNRNSQTLAPPAP